MLHQISVRWQKLVIAMCGTVTMFIGLGIISPVPIVGTAVNQSSQVSPPKNQYSLVNHSMSWSAANLYCEKRGAHLATITSAAENQAIVSLIASKGAKKEYWLGGVRGDDHWQWITGEAFSYTNWASGEPTDFGPDENRLSIIGTNNSAMPLGVWDDNFNRGYTGDFALRNFGLICERANSSSVRYTIVDQSMPWTEAAAYCDERGAHLATITSATENQAIISLIASKGTKKEYW